ncbi:MAG: HAMP domain-containing protein, partial [Pseudomonadota bacterium]
MRTFYNSIPIRFKLPIIIAGLSVISIIATSAVSFLNTRSALLADAEARMVSINRLQSRFLEEFFKGIDRDLTLRANSQLVADAIRDFSAAFDAYADPLETLQTIYITENPEPNGEKDQLTTSGVGDQYDRVHTKYHPEFDAVQDANGYYDVFLFDSKGNLIYSVFKELDYATNMIDGRWRDSGLATVFNKAIQAPRDGATTFDDFKPYEPSYGAPAAFFARPVFDDAGERIGVLAYQAPIDAINASMNGVSGLGETGEAILVGGDGLMRNDSPRTEETDILVTLLDDAAVSLALDGQVGFAEMTDGWGETVWASYGPLDLFDSRWAIVAKQSSSELLAPLNSALWKTIQAAAVAILIALAAVVFVARGLSRPLVGLNTAVQNIAKRDFDAIVPATDRGDEIGQIGQAIDAFRKDLKTAEESAVETAFKGAAFEVSGAPMMITNLDLEVLQINAALTRIMEDRMQDFQEVVPDFDPHKLIGLSMKRFAAFPSDVEVALEQPDQMPYRTKISVGDAYIGLLLDVVRDSAGNTIGYVLDWKDQTYQMQSQTLMQAIDGGQGRVEITRDRKVRVANDTFSEIVGIPLDEIVGMNCSGVIQPIAKLDDHTDFWEYVAADNGIFDHFRVSFGAKEVIVQGSLSPVKDHKGDIRGSILLGSDVTESYKEAAAKVRREREMTEAQAQVVRTLQSSLSKLSNGDLRSRIEDPMPEEYEVLRHDFNAAIDGLGSALSRIFIGANQIDGNANEVSSATVELSHRTETQATTLEKTAGALNDLSELVAKATAGTSEVAKVVNSTREN